MAVIHTTNMKRYSQRVKQRLPGGVHYNFRLPWEEEPIHFTRSKNSRLWDMDQKEYLDLYSRFGAAIIGHGHEEYIDKLKTTIDKVLCVSHCDLDAEVLELIAQFIPSAELIRFGLSGTEIIQNALRLARAYTGRKKFIRFAGNYHGNADNIMGGRAFSKSNPFPIDFIGDFQGTVGRADAIFQRESYILPWNNSNILEELLIAKSEEIAAIITEPVSVNGGSIMPKKGYLQKMRDLCNQYGIVLIFDEIITGCRMGLGGAQEEFGVTPDLTTLGKAIGGGGVPVSALVGKKEIMQLLTEKKVIHAGTFNGYPLGSAAIKATFEILSRDNAACLQRMNDTIAHIHACLQTQANQIGLPLVIQGPQGCAAYHITDQVLQTPTEYTHTIMTRDIILNTQLAKNGILVSSFSRLFPNISLNMDDVDYFEERVEAALWATKQILDEIND